MSDQFRAILVDKHEGMPTIDVATLSEADLMPGSVTVKVDYSCLNYKDGLGLADKAPIYKTLPMIPGVDFAGEVLSSEDDRYKAGDKVVLNGWGVGEKHFGGYAGRARVDADWLVPLPDGLTTRDAMAIGTAGYTAMLCVMALEDNGVRPDDGNVLVTGAAGGVGSVAIALLAGRGFKVTASTGRAAEADYLKSLGAADIIDRAEFSEQPKPLARSRWAGAVDSVGSVTLANVLSQMNYGATVAACGLAQGMDLPATVAPFILRGVKLIGIDSVMCPYETRARAWQRLADELDMDKLRAMVTEVDLADLPAQAERIIDGQVRGRMLVKI